MRVEPVAEMSGRMRRSPPFVRCGRKCGSQRCENTWDPPVSPQTRCAVILMAKGGERRFLRGFQITRSPQTAAESAAFQPRRES